MNTAQLTQKLREQFNAFRQPDANNPGQFLAENGKPVYKIAGLNAVNQGVLRQELVIRNNLTQYNFNFRQSPVPLASEVSLQTTDSFMAFAAELLIIHEETGRGGSRLAQSYPNAAHFPAAGGGFDPEDLEAFYNGILTFRQDQDVLIEGFPTRNFRDAPSAQQGDPLSATRVIATDVAAVNARAASEQNYTRNLVELIPFPFLRGEGTSQFTVQIPSWVGQGIQSATAGFDNRLVLVLHGLILKGYNGKYIPQLRG